MGNKVYTIFGMALWLIASYIFYASYVLAVLILFIALDRLGR